MKFTKKRFITLLLSLVMIVSFTSLGVATTLSLSTGEILMSLTRTEATLAEAGNRFTADSGVLADGAELTAWDNNTQITIGGTNRTPIVINNAALHPDSTDWQAASVVGVDNASAFQIRFSTTGFGDIRFSATQKSTGSGPDAFRLAYRIGSTGSFTPIDDSLKMPVRIGNDTYEALQQTYYRFPLPATVEDEAVVYLRVYFDGIPTLRRNGNTSINDIRITSGDIDPYYSEPPQLGERPNHVIINQVYGAAPNAGAVSRSFIELYNPTNYNVNLAGLSVQYIRGIESNGLQYFGRWQVLPLSGTLAANSSFLIVGAAENTTATARYTIENFDKVFTGIQTFSNRAFSVALVNGTSALTGVAGSGDPGGDVIDLVGVTNTNANDIAAFYESAPFRNISNPASARRINFADYDENNQDFERIDFRPSGTNDERLLQVRPRSTADGPWGEDILPLFRVPAHNRLTFSHQSGFYRLGFMLELSTAFPGGIIRYTTDGSVPTATSAEYTGPIPITNRSNQPDVMSAALGHLFSLRNTGALPSYWEGAYGWSTPNAPTSKGTAVRAKVFDADGNALTTRTHTHSYFVGLCNNYGELPIVSLTMDRGDLFDLDRGIYVHFEGRGREWERPVHFEIIEPDGGGIAQDMGMRIHGGWTRRYPQKSLRMYARADYSPNTPTLRYDLFDGNAYNVHGEPVTEFRRFILRNAGNDAYVSMMRCAMIQSLAEGLNVARQSYRQSIVFINGEFWGLHNIRERVDEHFYRDNFALSDHRNVGFFTNPGDANTSGGRPEELIEEPDNVDIQGDWSSYTEMWNWFRNLSGNMTDSQVTQASRFLDLDNFIDYWTYNLIVGQGDWPQNNLNMWRYRTAFPTNGEAPLVPNDGRWRYNLRDLDWAFDIYNDGRSTHYLEELLDGNLPSTLFLRRLMTNTAFRTRFITRSVDILNTNLQPEHAVSRVNEFADRMSPVMTEHHNFWRMMWGPWNSNVQRLRTFAQGRRDCFLSQLNNRFGFNGISTLNTTVNHASFGHIRVNTVDITDSTPGINSPLNWSGQYLLGSTQTITAVPSEVGRFSHFVVGANTIVTDNPMQLPLNTNTNVRAVFDGPELYPHIVADDNLLTNVRPGLTAQQFKSALVNPDEPDSVRMFRENTELTGTDALGTGVRVELQKGPDLIEFTVVIFGDVDGNGAINAADQARIRRHLSNEEELKDYFLIAADASRTGSFIGVDDMFALRKHILGVGNITQR